jgi:membrane protein DedA with SNARE-associated domain
MNELVQFIAEYGYLVVFIGVFIEQIGVPIPSNFLLIVAGALAGLGQLDLAFVIFLTVAAALLGDTIWFYIGRSRGFKVLSFMCRISLEPDSCVSGAKNMFLRHGARSLLVAKFVPGFSTVAQPIAGAMNMNLGRFIILDGLGSLIWAAVFVGLGYMFSDQFEKIVEYAGNFGWWFGLILIAGLATYIGWKFVSRQRFIRKQRIARIMPEDLKIMIDSEIEVIIIDLRDPLDFQSNPVLISSARRIPPAELEDLHEELPRDRDIILYCT